MFTSNTSKPVLSALEQRAADAWCMGAPKADSPQEARAHWAPYLSIWAMSIAEDALGTLSQGDGRERIGWIDDAAFWASFWATHADDSKVKAQSQYEKVMHMDPYIQGAMLAGSMTFFTTMPEDQHLFVATSVYRTNMLMEPAVAQWFSEMGLDTGLSVASRQSVQWRYLPWRTQEQSMFQSGRVYMDGPALVGLVCRAVKAGLCHPQEVSVLGHLMCNLPEDFDRREAVALIQETLGDDVKINVPLVALCSGYVVDDAPAAYQLAHIGAGLVKKALTAELRAKGGDMLVMLENVASVLNEPGNLYRSALDLGLYPVAPPLASLDVDEHLFVSPKLS